MDFPQKVQELGKEAVEISEARPCFLWTKGENGHHLGRLGPRWVLEAASSRHFSVEEQIPGRHSTRDKGPARRERLPGPQLLCTANGLPEASALLPPGIQIPLPQINASSWEIGGHIWRQYRTGVRNRPCHFLGQYPGSA